MCACNATKTQAKNTGTYPPLVGSPIVQGDPATPVRSLLHGLQGDITVEGATYNGQMPSWGSLPAMGGLPPF